MRGPGKDRADALEAGALGASGSRLRIGEGPWRLAPTSECAGGGGVGGVGPRGVNSAALNALRFPGSDSKQLHVF